MTQLEAALVEVTSFLDRLGLPHMLIGGLAVAMWGEPRATLDVDLSVWAAPEDFDRTVNEIAASFRCAPDALAFARRSRVLPILTVSGIRVDIVFASLPEERVFLARAKKKLVGGAEVRVAAVEDLVYMKLASERPKDRDDARRLIRRFRAVLDASGLQPRLAELAQALARPDILDTFTREMQAP